MYFGGVEGGATHSNLVICDEKGKVVGRSKGPDTNHWILGIEECATRVVAMVQDAKRDAGIPLDRPLDSLGLTLSGCGQASSNAELAAAVKSKDPNCSKDIYVADDTAGSLYTGAPNGGMVLIAGTGSNALLLTPEGEQHGCGGWGYLLGDEGGAYWIALKAVKAVFDDMDGFRPSPHPPHAVWRLVTQHFSISNRNDLLPHAYKNFEKPHFAALTSKLSSLAQSGDMLSLHLFNMAGATLAAHVVPLCPRTSINKLRVVCVGSVWNSWELLKEGFLKQLISRKVTKQLELVRLKVSSALGASWLAAKHVGYDLPRDDTAFCQVFYNYIPEEHGVQLNSISDANGKTQHDEINGKSHSEDGKSDTNGINGKCRPDTNGKSDKDGINGKSQFDGNGLSDTNGINGKLSEDVNGKMNGDHIIVSCGCTDFSNWS